MLKATTAATTCSGQIGTQWLRLGTMCRGSAVEAPSHLTKLKRPLKVNDKVSN